MRVRRTREVGVHSSWVATRDVPARACWRCGLRHAGCGRVLWARHAGYRRGRGGVAQRVCESLCVVSRGAAGFVVGWVSNCARVRALCRRGRGVGGVLCALGGALCCGWRAVCCGWRAVLPAVTRGGMVERGGPVLACRRLLWSLHRLHVAGGRGCAVGGRRVRDAVVLTAVMRYTWVYLRRARSGRGGWACPWTCRPGMRRRVHVAGGWLRAPGGWRGGAARGCVGGGACGWVAVPPRPPVCCAGLVAGAA